jgi:co-chaperonin GroES (HSP10)
MVSTKYSKFFTDLKEKGILKVPGSTLIVEILDKEELKSKEGIILSAPKSHVRGSIEENRLDVGVVVYAGEGYFNEETKQLDPTDIKVGAVVLLPKYSMSLVSVFPGIQAPTQDKLALVKEAQILAYYETQDAYDKAKELSQGIGE